ncbi:hypothetical protein [Pseudogemmobacter sp. W21_MBD1_M6]|jgi:dsRNA-specific ribonuclease|uniref:hypothetical protein n=1 Tax=Pseudogemmobacter sp. W21_MBD1_M6 TaxID=3240271 RepID=UPI003F9DCAC0
MDYSKIKTQRGSKNAPHWEEKNMPGGTNVTSGKAASKAELLARMAATAKRKAEEAGKA